MMDMKRFMPLLAVLVLLVAVPAISQAQEDTCLVYFTYTHCPNCEYTDPVVLTEWTAGNQGLFVIEYVFEGWSEPNGMLLGQYAGEYGTQAAVPQVFVNGDEAVSGRLGIPGMDVNGLEGNPCLMLEGPVDFSGLDLNSIEGEPLKIWSNGRLLVREKGSGVESSFLRELLLAEGVEEKLGSSGYRYRELSPEPAPISGGEIGFEKAFLIEESWLLQYNSSCPGSDNTTECSSRIVIPFFGEIDLSEMSLPAITVLLGLSDGFNPCAFFILSFLLSAMAYARSRRRILLVGGIFVFFSGLIYFMFMSLWLNVFILGTGLTVLTIAAAAVAIVAGVINIKDFFFFKKGVSLTLPTGQKERFMARLERLISMDSLVSLIAGTIILAVTVNMYELLCTIGFPFVYTRTLTLSSISGIEYYMYILFYNIMYVLPISAIVLIFAWSLGSRKFSVEGVKNLKLISGLMILFLGAILLLDYTLLENIAITFSILILAVALGSAIIIVKRLSAIRKGRKK